MTLLERLLNKIEFRDECWCWTAAHDRDGYGLVTIDHCSKRAHRVFYELFVGPIPDGLQLDHLCRVRDCVNPDHLEPVTCRENLMRGQTLQAANAAKTHCVRGHSLAEHGVSTGRGSQRRCRICGMLTQRERRARKKAVA